MISYSFLIHCFVSLIMMITDIKKNSADSVIAMVFHVVQSDWYKPKIANNTCPTPMNPSKEFNILS